MKREYFEELVTSFQRRDRGRRSMAAPRPDPLEIYVSAVIRLGQPMTKTELQIALAEATQTNKKTAALFLDTL